MPVKDRVGETVGKLTVVGRFGSGANGDALWFASCSCGGSIVDRWANMKQYTGCGCDQVKSGERSLTHGHRRREISTSRTYTTWQAMRERCASTDEKKWEYYGSIGITVCPQWQESFEVFLADMGERPEGMTLDRIDPWGNYEPGNCRWADSLTQRHNRRI